MNNKQLRRAMRKFLIHYGQQDTRKMISVFSNAYETTKQRVAGNLKTMKYDERTIQITTHIPGCYSEMK